jgi:hypothetical protein
MEEQNKQDKTDTTTNITPQTTKKKKRATGTDEQSEKRYITHKYIQNPENIQYYEGDALDRRINQNNRSKQQLNEEGDILNSSDEDLYNHQMKTLKATSSRKKN